MQTATRACLDLVPVLCDDVHQCLSDHSISSDEKMDVLSALSVEEFVVDGPDGSVSVSGGDDHRDVSLG